MAVKDLKVVIIIQARMGSTRLPGKVMKLVEGEPVLSHMIKRCRAMNTADEVVIATSDKPSDDVIEACARNMGVAVYRGSEQDVLSRYYGAAVMSKADIVVRITSDCPLIDPGVSDGVIGHLLNHLDELDYCCNWMIPSYPKGLDTEAFTFRALERAQKEAVKPYDREHVTPFIHDNEQWFRIKVLPNATNYSHYRWTLDYPEDFEFVTKVYARLYRTDSIFTFEEVLGLLEKHPEIQAINGHMT
jgi:spore coat polysaccharide biosynthesis protein SpsF